MFKNIKKVALEKFEAMDKSLSRAFSVWEILLVGTLLAFLVYNAPHKENLIKETTLPLLTKQERKVFTPLKERKSRCKSQLECRILAEAIVYEARSESELGQAAVAHVIVNRVNADRWADDVGGVVYQYKQFSYTLSKQSNVPTQKDWDKGYLLAYEVMEGMLDSPVGDATHYHTVDVKPKWAKSMEYVATIDRHIFYR